MDQWEFYEGRFDLKGNFPVELANILDSAKNILTDSEKIATKSARDVPRTSPEGPLKVLTSGTSKEPLGNSQRTNTKIDDLMKKSFLDPIVLVLHIYSFFLLEKQIFKRSKWGRPWDVYRTQLRDVPRTK